MKNRTLAFSRHLTAKLADAHRHQISFGRVLERYEIIFRYCLTLIRDFQSRMVGILVSSLCPVSFYIVG